MMPDEGVAEMVFEPAPQLLDGLVELTVGVAVTLAATAVLGELAHPFASVET